MVSHQRGKKHKLWRERRNIVGELHYKENEVLQCHKRSCIEESYSKINEGTKFSPSTIKDKSLGQYWNNSLFIVGMIARGNFMFLNT